MVIVSNLLTYTITAVTAVAAASGFALSATAISGLTGTVVLVWAGVAALTATLAVSVRRAVRAWRRGYWLGVYHGRSHAIVARHMEMARAKY